MPLKLKSSSRVLSVFGALLISLTALLQTPSALAAATPKVGAACKFGIKPYRLSPTDGLLCAKINGKALWVPARLISGKWTRLVPGMITASTSVVPTATYTGVESCTQAGGDYWVTFGLKLSSGNYRYISTDNLGPTGRIISGTSSEAAEFGYPVKFSVLPAQGQLLSSIPELKTIKMNLIPSDYEAQKATWPANSVRLYLRDVPVNYGNQTFNVTSANCSSYVAASIAAFQPDWTGFANPTEATFQKVQSCIRIQSAIQPDLSFYQVLVLVNVKGGNALIHSNVNGEYVLTSKGSAAVLASVLIRQNSDFSAPLATLLKGDLGAMAVFPFNLEKAERLRYASEDPYRSPWNRTVAFGTTIPVSAGSSTSLGISAADCKG